MSRPPGVHLVVGGYPPGSPAAHDMDFVRRRLLDELAALDGTHTTVSSDYAGLDRWLPPARLLLTYVAGPIPSDEDHAHLRSWLEAGGRWVALHGTSGGKAARVERDGRRGRMMVRQPHHRTLGGFFLNHPPVTRFTVTVAAEHPLTAGLPHEFDAVDELYLVEVQDPDATEVLLTTQLDADPSPPASASSTTPTPRRWTTGGRGRWASSTTSVTARWPTWPWGTATPRAPTASRSSTRRRRRAASRR